jgi:DNA-binding CsgD family transcriptional regulator
MKPNAEIRLTRREHEILHQMAKGLTREEIAAKFFISAETVRCMLGIVIKN